MNRSQQQAEARHRRVASRNAAQQRRHYFEAIRSSTVNYAATPMRRTSRLSPSMPDIDDPVMTRALQLGIILVMAGTVFVFWLPLAAALFAVLSSVSGF